MSKQFAFAFALVLLIALGITGTVNANPIEILSHAEAENCGRLTVAPDGGESLADASAGNEYRIHLEIWDSYGDPIVGIPETEMWLWHENLVTCPGAFSQADGPTDENGETTFSGQIFSGLVGDASAGVDCDTAYVYVYIMGEPGNFGEPVCVSTDSPDLNGDTSVGLVDFVYFVQDFNCEVLEIPCDPCHDYNEDGETGVQDFALFANYFNDSVCP